MVNAPEEVDAWTHGEMLRPSKRVLTDLVSVLQAVARHLGVSYPNVFKRCGFAAHTKFLRRPTTLTGCVHVIFNAGCQEDARFLG